MTEEPKMNKETAFHEALLKAEMQHHKVEPTPVLVDFLRKTTAVVEENGAVVLRVLDAEGRVRLNNDADPATVRDVAVEIAQAARVGGYAAPASVPLPSDYKATYSQFQDRVKAIGFTAAQEELRRLAGGR